MRKYNAGRKPWKFDYRTSGQSYSITGAGKIVSLPFVGLRQVTRSANYSASTGKVVRSGVRFGATSGSKAIQSLLKVYYR